MRTRPIVFTIGSAGSGFTVFLASNPEGYIELAQKAGLRLDSSEMRLAYLTTFLETTRSFAHRFQILKSVNEIQPRPNLSEPDTHRFRELLDKYRSVIRPPQISDRIPWECVVFALRRQNLVRIELKLTADGRIQANEMILEENVPIPYTL